MLIDYVKLNIKAGKGGDGVVRWRREKGIPFGGPAGGDGGKGGDVYLHVVRDIHALTDYKHKKEWDAEKGQNGKKRSMHGLNAPDLYLNIPMGSIVHNEDLDITYECLIDNEDILILRGGRGGYGNEKFKSAVNRTPEEFTPGQTGEFGVFDIQLDMIADIGIIGMPNAGKSSLLNSFTKAGAKVGDYAFTTLEPNLGAYHGLVLADIPGLIEGASDGKGLGHKFLKHIKRTRSLLHLISIENENVTETYDIIRKELGAFDAELLDKKEIIVLTQIDKVATEIVKAKYKELLSIQQSNKKLKKSKASMASFDEKVFLLSLYDEETVKTLGEYLRKQFIIEKIMPKVEIDTE